MATPAQEVAPSDMAKTILLAIALGIGGSVVASVFLAILTVLQDFVWQDLPAHFSLSAGTWWYVLAWAIVAAGLIAIAQRMPGKTGGVPITGLHFDIGPKEIASVALAAMATLALAMPLGPEAPLIACGTALGAFVARNAGDEAKKLAMLLGGAAAIGAVLGNPFISAFMFLEFAALGVLPAAALLPLLVSLGTGYLVMSGLGSFSGLGTHALSVSGLAPIDQLPMWSLATGLLAALVAGLLTLVARAIGWQVFPFTKRRPALTVLVAAIVIALVGAGAAAWADLPLDTVLFDGETGLSAVLASTSAGAIAIVTFGRMIVYGIALSAGFRGGPIFPAMSLGVGVGAMVALFVDPSLETPMVVAGIAACVAASLKLPFTAGLLALLVTSSAGVVTAPVAIIGAVVGFVMRVAHDKKWPPPETSAAPGSAAPAPAAA
ncbi:MAG: chloride channel protein [Candidatus Nanopelagicales bacterium]